MWDKNELQLKHEFDFGVPQVKELLLKIVLQWMLDLSFTD